jgi:ferredoxin
LLYADAAVLALTLGAATWLIYRKRSRKGIIGLSLFSLAYFGFYREGCICAIGSVQNVALGVFGNGYAVPLTVMVFFALPLLLALFAGRAFCAGACPHGALQDLVLIKPLPLPAWLEHGLGVLPFIYLGAGVLFAATGSAFIICQYDPFVPIFRMSGRTLMVLTGIALLVLGMFVGRPYCRFLCPYGALLKLASTVAKWRVRVTPDYCTQCRLCEASCPFGAMRQPEAGKPSPATAGRERTQLALLVAALPLLVILGAWVGYRFSTTAAGMHPTVSLARQYVRERDTPQKTGALTPDELALERARQNPEPLLAEALNVENRFRPATSAFGGWIGLVLGSKLISLSVRRKRTDYEPDRGDCFACARCFEYCPNELVRRGFVPAQPISAAKRGSPATAELASEGK